MEKMWSEPQTYPDLGGISTTELFEAAPRMAETLRACAWDAKGYKGLSTWAYDNWEDDPA